MNFKELAGKTIATAKIMGPVDHDDKGCLKLSFTDGTEVLIAAGHGGYTGKSEGEYPMSIYIEDDIVEGMVEK